MDRESYLDLLKRPEWQKKRLKVMEYADFRCQMCGDKSTTLHVHHSYYTKGKKPWQYPDGSLICICQPCHWLIHPEKKPVTIIAPPEAEEPFVDGYDVAAEFAKLRAKFVENQLKNEAQKAAL